MRLTVKHRFDYTAPMKTRTTPDISVLKALADERRLAMLELLADGGERCVCVLASALGMSDALVSHHVSKLREAGLVKTRRSGRWLHVRMEPEALTALAESLGGMVDASAEAHDKGGCGC